MGRVHVKLYPYIKKGGGAGKVYLPIPRTELFKQSVYYYGANLWNALPVPLRLLDDMDSFKLEINKIIVSSHILKTYPISFFHIICT